MTTTAVENLPGAWDDARDIPFFRITAQLFTAEFCAGAGDLLASYDDDTLDPTPFPSVEPSSGTTSTTGDVSSPDARDLIPVRVRRTT
jgi:hypothetical protein